MSSAAIERVVIVDDQPESRVSYGYTVENAELDPVLENGPLGSIDGYMKTKNIKAFADAALCDYELGAKAYASFTGAELVARWYRESFPAILCTRYEKAQIERIRPLRRWIPVLVKPDELTVDTLVVGLDECIRELQGSFRPSRRPWRTQVHFLRADDESNSDVYLAEVPGWDGNEVIRIRAADLPPRLAAGLAPDLRCHARVNLGAESAEELYVCDWEDD